MFDSLHYMNWIFSPWKINSVKNSNKYILKVKLLLELVICSITEIWQFTEGKLSGSVHVEAHVAGVFWPPGYIQYVVPSTTLTSVFLLVSFGSQFVTKQAVKLKLGPSSLLD